MQIFNWVDVLIAVELFFLGSFIGFEIASLLEISKYNKTKITLAAHLLNAYITGSEDNEESRWYGDTGTGLLELGKPHNPDNNGWKDINNNPEKMLALTDTTTRKYFLKLAENILRN